MTYARIIKECDCSPLDFELAKSKLEKALSALSMSPIQNGNPFLYYFVAGRQHIFVDKQFKIAATDGKKYYWNLEFLKKKNLATILAVLKHEIGHTVLMHSMYMQKVEYPKLLNIMADFIVNSMAERDWRAASNRNPNLFSEIGMSMTYTMFKDSCINRIESLPMLKQIYDLRDKENKTEEDEIKLKELREEFGKKYFKYNDSYIFSDPNCEPRSVMSLYKEAKEWYSKLDREQRDLVEKMFSMDDHLEPGDGDFEDQAMQDIFAQIELAKQAGKMPAELELALEEISDPTLNLADFIDVCIKKANIDGGKTPSYTRYKRRYLSDDIFYPRYSRAVINIAVLLDTSGSMSGSLEIGLAELKQFVDRANIYIVPVDAVPYWDKTSKVQSITDFNEIKISGGGGTVLQEFFRDFRQKLRRYGHFSSVIAITDGYIDEIPAEYNPGCSVGWIVIGNNGFRPPFGKAVTLL